MSQLLKKSTIIILRKYCYVDFLKLVYINLKNEKCVFFASQVGHLQGRFTSLTLKVKAVKDTPMILYS